MSGASAGSTQHAGKHCTHWIGGKLWDGAAERRGDIYNPATGQVSGTVDFASATVVGDAVAAAAKAFPGWWSASLSKRAAVMFAFRQLVVSRAAEPALVLAEGRLTQVSMPAFKGADHRGAGDSMTAGIAAGLARGANLEQALRLGAA